jgi:biopolymer transport protein ExbD
MRIKRRRTPDRATPDLTPMIDVTFQLLIFFILCTRFAHPEEEHRVNLPPEEGLNPVPAPPKEQLTIYCAWDEAAQANSYLVAIDARGRIPVEGSFVRLQDLVIYASDSATVVAQKRAAYKRQFDGLVRAIEAYIGRSGANIEKLEIGFDVDTARSSVQLTPPWLFVSLALDCCVQVNEHRAKAGGSKLAVTFKFADAIGIYR